jgi:type I restriction enzyme S subunit
MIEGLGPYPEYRDSGTRYLDPLPAHWRAVPLGRLGRFYRGMGGTKEDDVPEGVPVIRYGDLYTKFEFFITRSARFVNDDRAVDYAPIRRGDVLFAASGETIEEIGKSAVNMIESEARCGGDVLIFRPTSSLDRRFLGYATNAPYVVHQKAAMGRGFTVIHVYANDLRRLILAVPTVGEQAAIARFLRELNRRVGLYVRAKGRLIQVLEEQRQATVHRAVTRGLDPSARFKASGVDWLGDVPEHWELRRLRFLADITTGGSDTIDRKREGAYPFFVRSQTVERIDTHSFEGEAVLTAGDGAGVAKVFHYVDGKFDFHQRVYKFSGFRRVSGQFFYRYFSATLRFEAFRETAKSTVNSLRLPMLQNFPVMLPPPTEQSAIVAWIDQETSIMDSSLFRLRKEIWLIREYRARLAADVVTGKLDVREAAARLPVVDAESERLEAIGSLAETEEDTTEDLDSVPEEVTA